MKWTLLLVLLPLAGWAAKSENWDLKRDRDDIAVFTRAVEGSKFKQVKSTMRITSSLNAVVSLIQDTSACGDWAALCKYASIHERVSATEMYIYTYNDVPWPVTDRDALTHIVWHQDPETLTVTMTAKAVPDRMPETEAVRVRHAETSWVFSPQGDGTLQITSKAHIDPAGPIPAWMTNLLLIDAPFDTMRQMRQILATGRYDNKRVEFIAEAGLAVP